MTDEEIKPRTGFSCLFCEGCCYTGVDAHGLYITHSVPPCTQFKTQEMDEFLSHSQPHET